MTELTPNNEIRSEAEIRPEIEEIIKPEIKPEVLEQKKEAAASEQTGETPGGGPRLMRVSLASKKDEISLARSATIKEVENILSENLNEVYQTLPETMREQFRKKGEETASKIEKILSQTKIAVNKILDLIRNWLKIIPGINQFFMEQESKIKTDKILKLAERKRKQKLNL